MNKKTEYPEVTAGTRLAAKIRKECNNLSPEERQRLTEAGLAIISHGHNMRELASYLSVLKELEKVEALCANLRQLCRKRLLACVRKEVENSDRRFETYSRCDRRGFAARARKWAKRGLTREVVLQAADEARERLSRYSPEQRRQLSEQVRRARARARQAMRQAMREGAKGPWPAGWKTAGLSGGVRKVR